MTQRKRDIIVCLTILLFIIGMAMGLFLKTPSDYSESERRTLVKDFNFTTESFADGSFMNEFEDFGLDQFPLRDTFRSIKAVAQKYIFGKDESNDIVYKGGYLSKIEYPMDDARVEQSIERMTDIYMKYLREKGIAPYFAIVPDKNYYLSQEEQILSMDYDEFYYKVLTGTGYMEYIELRDLLELKDYYYTDTHWRQECLGDVADRVGTAMGVELSGSYAEVTLDIPFNGVYVGQAALPVKPDTIKYLNNDVLQNCIVKNYDTGEPVNGTVYDMDKASGKDPYEMFLSGSSALITVENPNADTDRELVVFRDSFGSSLVPLLAEGYHKVTLVDLRYIQSDMIGYFIDFENQDVLFMYSTLMLNNGLGGGM